MNRRRRQKIVLAAWLALFFLLGFGAWSFQGGELMLLAWLVLGAIAYAGYAFLARCPHCGMPVLLRPRSLFGVEFFTWSLLPPERCRHCGAELP